MKDADFCLSSPQSLPQHGGSAMNGNGDTAKSGSNN